MTLAQIEDSDPRDLTDAQIIAARATIGAAKLAIRQASDVRSILTEIERAGYQSRRDPQTGERTYVMLAVPPVNRAHGRLIEAVRPLNRMLERVNVEFEGRTIGRQSRG